MLPEPRDDTEPEREIASGDHHNGEHPAARRVYEAAFEAYMQEDHAKADRLLRDCLKFPGGYAEAESLLAVVEAYIMPPTEEQPVEASMPAPRVEVTAPAPPPRSRVLEILPQPFAWIEIPAGRVTIDKHGDFDVPMFEIAKYPVTNAQFAPFMEAGGYRERRWWTDAGWAQREEDGWTEPRFWRDDKWNGAEYPVVGVSWYEAVAFCRWLGEASGEAIMLPTEQQWQRAAQGDDGRMYPWGNTWDGTRCRSSVGWLNSPDRTTPVRKYEGRGDSPFGVVDMAGNVWEWCVTAYATGSDELEGTDARVLRGGSWLLNVSDYFRAVYRSFGNPSGSSGYLGFRCARSRDA